MSGRPSRVSLRNEIGNPLVGESRQPDRHGEVAAALATKQRKPNDAASDIEFRQITDICNTFKCFRSASPHSFNSPRSNTERNATCATIPFRLVNAALGKLNNSLIPVAIENGLVAL